MVHLGRLGVSMVTQWRWEYRVGGCDAWMSNGLKRYSLLRRVVFGLHMEVCLAVLDLSKEGIRTSMDRLVAPLTSR